MYSSLDPEKHEIRLLVLQAGSYDQPLTGTLRTFRLPATRENGSGEFETISYVWGDQSVRDTILVNSRPLDIPASAAAALKCMRFHHAERSLWIDSVCINQADVQERGQQVPMMAQIYSYAYTNLVHLSDDEEKAERAFDSIERVMREVEDETRGVNLHDFIFDDSGILKQSNFPLACEPDVAALTWLFGRPWFSRLWVIQEQLLSSRSMAYCGSLSIPMSEILIAAMWCEFKQRRLPTSMYSQYFRGAVRMFFLSSSARDLTTLLMQLGPLECSDIRDKVFGGLGLYQSENRLDSGSSGMPDALRPDYTKSPAHVLRDVTRLCIKDRKDLFLLARFHYEPHCKPEGLPTWIPNWHRFSLTHEPFTYAPQLFNACGSRKDAEILLHPDANVLSLRGMIVASISQYTPITTCDNFENIHELTDQLQCIRKLFFSVQHSEAVLAMSLIAGLLQEEGADADSALSAWEAFQAYIKLKVEPPPSSKTYGGDVSQDAQAKAKFQYSLRQCIEGRRYFTTTEGQVGTGPPALRTGDLLVILPGSTVPFALRSKGENYTMVGQVYVHGVMHGEALDIDFQPPPQWMTFNIE